MSTGGPLAHSDQTLRTRTTGHHYRTKSVVLRPGATIGNIRLGFRSVTRPQEVGLLLFLTLMLGWDLWEALGNVVGLQPFYDVMGIGESVPWVLLWAGVFLPVIALVVSLALWRRLDGAAERLGIMVATWAVVAAVSLSFAAIEQAWRASALQALAG